MTAAGRNPAATIRALTAAVFLAAALVKCLPEDTPGDCYRSSHGYTYERTAEGYRIIIEGRSRANLKGSKTEGPPSAEPVDCPPLPVRNPRP